MKQQLILAAGAALVICGCAHTPRVPLPPKTPGTLNFIITGDAETVAAFSGDARIPQNCALKSSGIERGKLKQSREAAVQVAYRCQNATPDTIRAMGEVYFAVLNRNSRVKAASLEPLRLGQTTTSGESMQVTTTDCLLDACNTDVQYSWMPPGGACTDLCY